MNKETIAKALLKYDYPDVVWEKIKLTEGLAHEEYLNRAEAVNKALEAEVPKSLMDCMLSLDERHEITSTYGFGMEMTRQIAEAQLKKVAPFVEAQKQDLEIELQMANDMIVDYKGEVAELKASVEAQVVAERDKFVKALKKYISADPISDECFAKEIGMNYYEMMEILEVNK